MLHLAPGTYFPNGSIEVYSTIRLEGLNATDTIIDFNNKAYNFLLTGTNVYTTGTISSIAGGVNVTGSGTAWTSAMVGRQIFIDERWYGIAAVPSATSITLESGYADGATFSGTYRIADPIIDTVFSKLKIRNSTATAINGTDVRDLSILNCVFLDNNKGFTLTNFMNVIVDTVSNISATSNGYELTNGSFCNNYSHASVSNGGHGAVLNNIKSCGWILSASNSNTSDGINATDVTNCLFQVEASSNGGQGIEFVSGCNNNFIDNALVNSNTSDGIKLTGTCDKNTIGPALNLVSNGGYGINVAASTCDDNIILSPIFDSNTSGGVNDSGTSTIFVPGIFLFVSPGEFSPTTNTSLTTGLTLPLLSFADGVTGDALCSIRFPATAKSISSIKVLYTREVSANLRLRFNSGYIDRSGLPYTTTEDASDTTTTYTSTGSDNKIDSFTVPAGAYSTTGSGEEGDIFSFAIIREGGEAADTYNQAWNVVGVEITFALQ